MQRLSDAADAVLKQIKADIKTKNKLLYTCSTDWSTVLQFENDSASFMQSKPADEEASIRRCNSCVNIIESLSGANSIIPATVAFPFRAGKYCMSGLPTYKRVLAAWEIYHLTKKYMRDGDVSVLSSAFTLILQTPTWPHGDAMCPPQLTDGYRDGVLALLFILIYRQNVSTGTPVQKDTGTITIETLQYINSVYSSLEINRIIAHEVSVFWVSTEADPRHGRVHGFQGMESALAVIQVLGEADPNILLVPAVSRFMRTNRMLADYSTFKKAEYEFSIRSPCALLLPVTEYRHTPYIAKAIDARTRKSREPLILSSVLCATLICRPQSETC